MISRPASDQKKRAREREKNESRKSDENESNYKSTRQQNWEEEKKMNEQIYTQTDIFVLNWKTDKKTNALVHLFSITNLFPTSLSLLRKKKNCSVHLYDNWLSDWWCIARDESHIDMIMNTEKRDRERNDGASAQMVLFRITMNNKRFSSFSLSPFYLLCFFFFFFSSCR